MRGSITIYLSIIFTIILGLICTLIESSRVNAMESKLNGMTYMALDSSFAGYASPLFKEYGLLFLWCDEAGFSSKLEDYLSYNIDIGKGILSSKNTDLYRLDLENIDITGIEFATDKNGKVFENQIYQYMKYAALENMVENMITQANLFNQSSVLKKFYDKIGEFREVFIKVEDSVSSIKDSIDKIQNVAENPRDLIEKILANAETGTGYLDLMSILKDTDNELLKCLSEIQEKTNSYLIAAEDAKGAVLNLSSELENSKSMYQDEVYNILDGELKDLKEKTTYDESDYYGIKSNSETVSNYLNKLKVLNKFCMESNITINELEKLKEEFSDFDIKNLHISYEKQEVSKDKDNILDYIKKLKENGILGLVVENPEKLSDENTETKDLPSYNDTDGSDDTEKNSVLKTSKTKLLYSEYLLTHFGNYVEQKEDTKMLYEMEYIVNGADNDKENLSGVVNDIILIREGCNLIYLLKSPEKRQEAFEMATAIVGFTGSPILINLTQFLILSAWAYGESILDVKNLLSGKKVDILKSDSNWNLSLAGLKNLNSQTESSKSAGTSGLNYGQYLRILLLTKNTTNQYYRTMDLIQLNLCKRENPDFRMDQCINKVSINVNFTAKPLFITLPFVKNTLGYHLGKYKYNICQQYEY